MNTQMGSALLSEKLHEDQPVATAPEHSTWEQAASRVMYCLVTCVHDHMLGYIREAKTPKETWENLRKNFAANTTARRLHLHQELNSIQQRDMSITAYTLKIKDLCDSLGSISVNIYDDEMVQICLGGLAPRFGTMRTTILAREKCPSFFELQSMLLVEENHVRTRSNESEGHMLPLRPEPSTRNRMRILRKARPSRRRVLKEEA